jgi:hypothetical protein
MRGPSCLLALALLLSVAACGEDAPEPSIEAGGCVSVDGERIAAVDCAADDADSLLVVRISEGYPCPDGLTSLTYVQTLDGREVGLPQRWCVAEAGADLTAEQQEYLDRELENS